MRGQKLAGHHRPDASSGTIKRIHLNTKEEIWEAIKKLRVRGAPAIGAAAAYGIAPLASGIAEDQYDAFYSRFKELKDYLASVQANGCQSVLGVKPYGGGCDCQQGKGRGCNQRSCSLRRRIGFARRISKSAAVSGRLALDC